MDSIVSPSQQADVAGSSAVNRLPREDRDPSKQLRETEMSQVNGENSHQQFNQSRVHPLKQAAQELIESVNIKRQQDTELESDLRRSLEELTGKTCLAVQHKLSDVYDKSSQTIQEKLEELFATLSRIEKLELELKHVSKALGNLYADMQDQS